MAESGRVKNERLAICQACVTISEVIESGTKNDAWELVEGLAGECSKLSME
jgi:hypothetical protein